MRSLCALSEAIRVRTVTNDYYIMAFHAKLAGAEILSLEEVLGVESSQSPETEFEKEKDEALTRYALKKQREMEKQRGG